MTAVGAVLLLFVVVLFWTIFPPLSLAMVVGIGWVFWKEKKEKEDTEEESRRLAAEEKKQEELQTRYAVTLTAAQDGDLTAQYDYAQMVRFGQGCAPDARIAVGWMKLAADRGHAKAQEELASIFDCGLDEVQQDLNQASTYYSLAAAQGSQVAARRLEAIAERRRVEEREAQERLILGATADEWPAFKHFLSMCESEPEVVLLKALICAAGLKPGGKVLTGKISVQPQVRLLRYRVDFLVDGRLVVEVDGKQYHDNSASFESDRRRDQELLLAGFRTIRFPASQVFSSPLSAAEIVMRAATSSPQTENF